VYGIYFARCMNIFNSLLLQLVKYDVHTTLKINSIHAIFYHILSLSSSSTTFMPHLVSLQYPHGTKCPITCWCAIKKILTHLLLHGS